MKEALKEKKEKIVLSEEETQIVMTEGQEIDSLIPQMNLTNNINDGDVAKIISDETLVGLYDEILNDLRKKDEEYSGYLSNIADMVINGGDATPASKEMLVGLAKVLSDIPDKKSKVADLMTRLKLRERDTMPRWLAAKQNNNITISDGGIKREILRKIELEEKKAKKNGT
jgi:hypothetical protein